MAQFIKRLRVPAWKPSRVFAFVLLLVFGVEGAIMLVLGWPWFPESFRGRWPEALIDSLSLTIVLAPVLWLSLVRPLQRLSASRGQLLGQLFEAQEQERGRLARDLHDELGQHLTAIMIGLRTIDQAENLEQARERAAAAAQAGAAGLSEVRRIARALRPTVLEDLGLAPAVERACEEFRALHNVPVELGIDLEPGARFAPQVELCVFRVLQESLTNIARHAAARSVRVHLGGCEGRAGDRGLVLRVADDGCGFAPDERSGLSFGLNGMRERVELLGGQFEMESTIGAGTTIRAELPAGGAAAGGVAEKVERS